MQAGVLKKPFLFIYLVVSKEQDTYAPGFLFKMVKLKQAIFFATSVQVLANRMWEIFKQTWTKMQAFLDI